MFRKFEQSSILCHLAVLCMNLLDLPNQLSTNQMQHLNQQPQQVQQPAQQPQQNQSQEVSQNNNQSYSGGSNVSSVAQEMQSRTGVSASEWSQIIQRESNGEVNATNASSGAHGLFQSEHNPGNTIQSQINDAVQVYKSQGLSAWSETR